MSADRTIAVLAEKPSVARDLAKVLGAGQRGNGFLHGNGRSCATAATSIRSPTPPAEGAAPTGSWA